MNLKQFRRMWSDCSLVEIDRREAHGATWILFNVTEPDSTTHYGRHYGLYVILNPAGQIIGHNIHNTSQNGTGWIQQVREWWERHLVEGLVDPNGQAISLEVS